MKEPSEFGAEYGKDLSSRWKAQPGQDSLPPMQEQPMKWRAKEMDVNELDEPGTQTRYALRVSVDRRPLRWFVDLPYKAWFIDYRSKKAKYYKIGAFGTEIAAQQYIQQCAEEIMAILNASPNS